MPIYSSCIDKYVERQINCKVPWIASENNSHEICTMANQTIKYLEISKKISMMRDAEVAEKTGCHIPCQRNEFNTKSIFMTYFIFVQMMLLFVSPQNDYAES